MLFAIPGDIFVTVWSVWSDKVLAILSFWENEIDVFGKLSDSGVADIKFWSTFQNQYLTLNCITFQLQIYITFKFYQISLSQKLIHATNVSYTAKTLLC